MENDRGALRLTHNPASLYLSLPWGTLPFGLLPSLGSSAADRRMTLSPSLRRPVLLPDPPHQADLRRSGASLSQRRCSDRKSGPDLRSLETSGIRPLRCGLAGGWQRPLPHLPAEEALQSHGGCRALRGVPR